MSGTGVFKTVVAFKGRGYMCSVLSCSKSHNGMYRCSPAAPKDCSYTPLCGKHALKYGICPCGGWSHECEEDWDACTFRTPKVPELPVERLSPLVKLPLYTRVLGSNGKPRLMADGYANVLYTVADCLCSACGAMGTNVISDKIYCDKHDETYVKPERRVIKIKKTVAAGGV